MDKISDVLGLRQTIVTTGEELNKPIVTTETIVRGKAKDQVGHACDIALEDFSDVICNDFRAWYCKAFYKIGNEKFRILASQARADGNGGGAKLFSYLLKKELSAR